MRIPVTVAALLLSLAAHAGEAEQGLTARWYDALGKIDRTAIGALLSDKAKINLGDLDIIQTKAEFIASLDEWEDAMKGSTLRHAVESDNEGVVTELVCYTFPDNESLTRESFTFESGQIVESNQETLSDSCAEFPQ